MIRLQTAEGRDIPNHQSAGGGEQQQNLVDMLLEEFPDICVRTDHSSNYNCFGLVFASHRVAIEDVSFVQDILEDDNYQPVERCEALPGDLILYFGENRAPAHAGLVVANEPELYVPKIVSKWGGGPEVIHQYRDVPAVYLPDIRFYRCRL